MMRGEEVQVVGIADQLPQMGSGLLILPGTHSKHIEFKDGVFCDLRTYMTGELFSLLAKESILSYSLEEASFDDVRKDAFKKGVLDGVQLQVSAKLFSIRANDLLHKADKSDNYFYLSGLLIGEELSKIEKGSGQIYLLASQRLGQFYGLALETIFSSSVYITIPIDNSTLAGQKKVLTNFIKNQN